MNEHFNSVKAPIAHRSETFNDTPMTMDTMVEVEDINPLYVNLVSSFIFSVALLILHPLDATSMPIAGWLTQRALLSSMPIVVIL
jgi:hypothetical protein